MTMGTAGMVHIYMRKHTGTTAPVISVFFCISPFQAFIWFLIVGIWGIIQHFPLHI